MRSVPLAFWREKNRARGIGHAGFLPVAREDIDQFVGQWMRMGGNGGAGVKFSQDRDPARGFILVQHEQFDAGIWPRLPGFVSGQSDVLEHLLIERGPAKIASKSWTKCCSTPIIWPQKHEDKTNAPPSLT